MTTAVGTTLQVAFAVFVIGTQFDTYPVIAQINSWTLARLAYTKYDHSRLEPDVEMCKIQVHSTHVGTVADKHTNQKQFCD